MTIKRQVCVLGDLILDESIMVRVKGPCKESEQVLACEILEKTYSLGGAANVAANVNGLGMITHIVGALSLPDFMGDFGAPTRNLCNMLDSSGMRVHLIPVSSGSLAVRSRVRTRTGVMLRLDSGTPFTLLHEKVKRIEEYLLSDAVMCLVNYNHGFFEVDNCIAVMQECNKTEVPVLVDPGRTPWSCFYGNNVLLKANLHQCLRHLGLHRAAVASSFSPRIGDELDDNDVHDPKIYYRLADKIVKGLAQDGHACRFLVMTCGAGGLGLMDCQTGVYMYFPAETNVVVDTCGAGDTVMAALAYVIADVGNYRFETIQEGCKLAVWLAGKAVQQRGVYVAKRKDVPGCVD